MAPFFKWSPSRAFSFGRNGAVIMNAVVVLGSGNNNELIMPFSNNVVVFALNSHYILVAMISMSTRQPLYMHCTVFFSCNFQFL